MVRALAVIAVTSLMLTAAPFSAPAQAAQPSVTAPADGTIVNGSFAGPITVDLTGSPEGRYYLTIDGEGVYREFDFMYDGTETAWTVELLQPLRDPGEYTVSVNGEDGAWDQSSFQIAAPAAEILSPASESVHRAGRETELAVRWSGIAAGTKVRMLVTDSDWSTVEKCTATAAAGEVTRCSAAGLRAGKYTARAEYVRPGDREIRLLAKSTFFIEEALDIRGVTVSRETFYPVVRDGYRDSTLLRYRTTATARHVVTVVNANGKTVRREVLGQRRAGTHSWRWDGRKNSGEKVTTGVYRIKVAGTDLFGKAQSATAKTTVATSFKTVRTTKRRGGDDPSAAHATGNCSGNYLYDSLYLDCWGGGGHATAKYGFSIPASAFNFDWGTSTEQGCCLDGMFRRTGSRPTRTRYVVQVTIDDWRSVYIYGVRLSYSYRKRI